MLVCRSTKRKKDYHYVSMYGQQNVKKDYHYVSMYGQQNVKKTVIMLVCTVNKT